MGRRWWLKTFSAVSNPMDSLRTFQSCGLSALAAGVAISFFTRRAPVRGWIGVLMLLIASVALVLIDPKEDSRPSHLSMLVTFLLVAPVAVVYSFRAPKAAPDRTVALAAFAGSFIVTGFWLFMVVGIVASFFVS
jgi:hypothetical membrane protein